MKVFIVIALLPACLFPVAHAQSTMPQPTATSVPVSVLGVPGQIPHKGSLASAKQRAELDKVVRCLGRYKPTIITVPTQAGEQPRVDSLYQAYLAGHYRLGPSATDQLGFRLAKQLGHQRVYCVDAWGDYQSFIDQRGEGFWQRYGDFKHESLSQTPPELGKTGHDLGLLGLFSEQNSPEMIAQAQAQYFTMGFFYEDEPNDYSGVDWATQCWYNRNLRIIRNLSRIQMGQADRVLMIHGTAHHALLRDYLGYSPYFQYVPITKYLK